MKKVFDNVINSFWLRNLLVILLLSSMTFLFTPEKGMLAHLKSSAWTLLLYLWILVHNLVLVEKALAHKKYVLYGIGLLFGLGYFTTVMKLFSSESPGRTLFSDISTGVLNTIVGMIFYFAFKYITEQNTFLKNKLFLNEMEQKYLVSQLSPHFLFNTLNNIYSHSINEKVQTPELLLRLSELMRYLIDFSKKDRISLEEEISFIENYVAFEEKRLSDRCKIMFEKDIREPDIPLEPLLFFPLIENAFKHGTHTLGECYVILKITEMDGVLHVTVENLVRSTNKPSTHTGIQNVKRRLELLYPGRHTLDLRQAQDKFTVSLRIQLKK